ncbi:MAG TPA: ATP-dependent Clp protease ATP-binding subunit [Planctomycetota bacterium]|nr:ATP-dependent Clp protease ATP-binding subunit [Planctomycetota bacterium]HRR81886.1 ATP-dependent Clp protease ATP-binding subunit [Planctomycetota bacterium]HRT95647.1 ATP-dependent Clp protease ATP-binding subunit [Planctomycetota bacterium]
MFDRFTERARKVMSFARLEAQRFHHDYVGTEHILLALVKEGTGVASVVLKKMGVELKEIRAEIEKVVERGPEPVPPNQQLPYTPRAKRVLELALEEARSLGHHYIGTEHLLLGLLREQEGIAAQVLVNLGLKLEEVRDEIHNFLGSDVQGAPDAPRQNSARKSKSDTPALDSFGRDLTELAREGKLDPVIGRKHELQRLIQILARRTKNNPVLIGEAGVGKSAIVEGFAQRVVSGDLPELLRDRRIVILDLALMVAGTKYRGQFEERIKAVMNEVRKAKNVILFIDELHTLVGAGGAEGAIDASNVLKPALSRGEIQVIGATTLNEYRKYIEKDTALERRFQTVMVDPLTKEETLQILKEGLRDRYEAHHRVHYTEGALKLAVELSDRYITGRYLPDKAIDVIDEAGALKRMEGTTKPPELTRLEEEIKRLHEEKESSVASQDFERAAGLRDRAQKLRAQYQEAEREWRRTLQENAGTVDEGVIERVVANMTKIPLERLEATETARLLNMEAELHKRVVSQEEAIKRIANAVRRSRSGLKDPRRPAATFLFLGPTGVGKTLLARALAEFLFGEEDALVQIDMSEYMQEHNVSRLIGAPPGYVGYDEGGQLTEKIRRRPYSVVLFDEIEKAHRDALNILLQIMEDGRLTDSFGRHVDFRNTIVIMTSNIGSDVFRDQAPMGFGRSDNKTSFSGLAERVMAEVKRHLRPEFLGRLDGTIIFTPLTDADYEQIVDILFTPAQERARERGVEITLSHEAKKFLVAEAKKKDLGARPLRQLIETQIEDLLAEEFLRGSYAQGDTVLVTVRADKLFFQKTEKAEPVLAEAASQA